MILQNSTSSNKEEAVRLAELGLPVFGSWWSENGVCACGKDDCGGKHPHGWSFPQGYHSATHDPVFVGELWGVTPQMNVSISLWVAGIVCLEIDDDAQLEQLKIAETHHGPLPVTWVSVSGGRKQPAFWFRSPWPADAPLRKSAIVLPCGELKRDAITVAPSVHRSGGRYTWQAGRSPFECELAPLPDWLRLLAEGANGKGPSATQDVAGESWTVREQLDGCLEDHPGVDGERHNTALSLVGRCAKQHGLDGLLQRAEEWNSRNSPPLPDQEIREIVDHVARAEADSLGVEVPDYDAAPTAALDEKPSSPFRPVDGRLVSPFSICTPQSAKDVSWLWPGHIPRGMITLLAGESGVSKSSVTCDFAAKLSAGLAFPDGYQHPVCANSAFLNFEDDFACVVAPRIAAAGGDGARVICHDLVVTHPDGKKEDFDFFKPTHVDSLVRMLRETGCELFVVDPLMAALNGKKDVEAARPLMRALAGIASELHIGLIAVTHYSKDENRTRKNRVLGSGQWVASARLVWSVEEEPETGRRILWPSKSNISRTDRGWAYRIEEVPPSPSMPQRTQTTTRCVWEPQPVLRPIEAPGQQDARTALDEAVAFLLDELRDGPKPVKATEENADAAGIRERTFRRAKKQIGVATKRIDGTHMLCLPEALQTASETGQVGQVGQIP